MAAFATDAVAPPLVIKAPNEDNQDILVEGATLGWTVRQLKNYLSSVHPEHPRESEQNLVYFGQILLDHLKLGDVLRQRPQGQQQTIHLVVARPDSAAGLRQRRTTAATTTTATTATPAMSEPAPPVTPYATAPPTPAVANAAAAAQYYMHPYAMYGMQAAYAQYAAQLQQYYQLQAQYAAAQAAMPTPDMAPMQYDDPVPDQGQDANPAVAAAAEAENADRVGPVAGDAAPGARPANPLVTMVLLLVRLVFTVMVFGQYATPARFTWMCVAAAVFFLYQCGFFGLFYRRRPAPPPAPRRRPQENADGAVDGDGATPGGENAAEPAVPEERPSALVLLGRVTLRFFTSLLPNMTEEAA